jgi:hypothetical protein
MHDATLKRNKRLKRLIFLVLVAMIALAAWAWWVPNGVFDPAIRIAQTWIMRFRPRG